MTHLKRFTSAFFVSLIFLLLINQSKAKAFEGTVEMRSKTDTRCYAVSVYMRTNSHKMVVSCVNLVFPPATDRFAYVLWGTPETGRGPLKLGSLNTGKAEFTFNPTLTNLFVTIELHDGVRSPSNDIIMIGTPKPITFLTEYQAPIESLRESPTEAPTEGGQPSDSSQAENFGEIIEEAQPQLDINTEQPSIINFFRRGGIILAIGGFIFLIILAFLTRARG